MGYYLLKTITSTQTTRKTTSPKILLSYKLLFDYYIFINTRYKFNTDTDQQLMQKKMNKYRKHTGTCNNKNMKLQIIKLQIIKFNKYKFFY